MLNNVELQINFENLLKLGYAVIDVRFKDYDLCGDSQKLVIARVDADRDEFYQDMLKLYTGQDFKSGEIYEIWTEDLASQDQNEPGRRDIAIKVAALDYVETIFIER